MKNRRKVIYSGARPYIWFMHRRHYFDNIDDRGYDTTCFTNCGYYGGFTVTGFEYGIEDYAIIEKAL